ncbi:MAG: glutamine synthetase [Firmicutes bacterium]|nr:glutamine synthetase [Bacillota bacterium]
MTELIHFMPPSQHNPEDLEKLLSAHPEIRFVSLMGVDLGGNATDEKIPVNLFLRNCRQFLEEGVQTDGSSVILHDIATLNDAKVDLLPDLAVNWFVDYNREHLWENQKPVGTLRIPAFLIHKGKAVDSRSVLKRAAENFQTVLETLLKEQPELLAACGAPPEHVAGINLTAATELEFWVQTPRDRADVEKLATSQSLKEQYWKRTQGAVRTALEKSLLLLEQYGLEPEMGHKEVGGVSSTLAGNGKFDHVMEQLEIDWRYSTPLQTADNELLAREMIADVFRSHGLDITFAAKPIDDVAGSGKHAHFGASVTLADGEMYNLFNPADMKADYLSPLGYGALMGLLKNYEAVSPFVTASNDAFNRMQPGFEAPVCTVASLGHSTSEPSRNRSVLVGLVREPGNPRATRLELRAPNPQSNTYLVLASVYQAMVDGIVAMAKSGLSAKELEMTISKPAGEDAFYLESNRAYRSEENVFEHYNEAERNQLFGTPPATVWENLAQLDNAPEKTAVLLADDVFTPAIIGSYRAALLEQWTMELEHRILPTNLNFIRECKKLHADSENDADVKLWNQIKAKRDYLARDTLSRPCLSCRIRTALASGDYQQASDLQQEMAREIANLRQLYRQYRRNILD